jgi:hypothetical protein
VSRGARKTVKEFIDMLCEERVVKSVNAGGLVTQLSGRRDIQF